MYATLCIDKIFSDEFFKAIEAFARLYAKEEFAASPLKIEKDGIKGISDEDELVILVEAGIYEKISAGETLRLQKWSATPSKYERARI